MTRILSILAAVAVLAIHLCSGEKSCSIWSSAGPVVQLGSSFKVYCTFTCKCKGSMYIDHPPTLQSHSNYNSTTIYFNVVNITKNRTYSCQCTSPPVLDPCGLDILAGYPPEHPRNISCVNKVISEENGVVNCTWNHGRDTYLRNSAVLWVRTFSGNHTTGPLAYSVPWERTDRPFATFTVSTSVKLISVWVQIKNQLGSVESLPINYSLSDIAMPSTPYLGHPDCSSRVCNIQVNQSVMTQNLEIQYSADGAQTWTSYPDSGEWLILGQVPSISSLEPYRWYHFRARSKFSTGLWSSWSTSVSCQTQEEAPAKELDVWYNEPATDFKSLKVYWKELNISYARGKITEYKIKVFSPNSEWFFSTNISADTRNYSVPFCTNCEVKVWSCNSKGLSPPASVRIYHKEAKQLEVVYRPENNHSVAISWRKPETAGQHIAQVVEWYPEGQKLERFQWIKLGRNDNHAVLTGVMPFECYEGAVYVVYNDKTVSGTRFTGVTTLESGKTQEELTSVPAAVPAVREKVEGNKVEVSWVEVPRGQRGGCITNYTIYLENSNGVHQSYSIPASENTYIIEDLSPATYSLWVTASTTVGEGPVDLRSKVKFFIQEDSQRHLLVMLAAPPVVLICLFWTLGIKQRFWGFIQRLMLSHVPDPANSKWAKECTLEKGEANFQVQPSNSRETEEEEPILVDVEELPTNCDKHTSIDVSPQTNMSPLSEGEMQLYPLTTYIKSFSHDSDRSNTQSSLDTNTTVDYISSHGHMEEEEEEEEEFEEIMDFFPSQSIVLGPLDIGGKLTLDAVKIPCSDFFSSNL